MQDKIKLYKGDCLTILKQIPDNSIDMVLTDPPYGISNLKWDKIIDFRILWEELNRITKDHCVIALFGCEPFSTRIRMSNIKNYKFDWLWAKSNIGGFANAKHRPLKTIENICVFSNGKPRYYPRDLKPSSHTPKRSVRYDSVVAGHGFYVGYQQKLTGYPKDVLHYKNEKGFHPTQKPVPLLEYLIRHHTEEGETVLDFTMGSGSTGVACINTNRKFIGIEISDKYFEIAQQRMNINQE